MATSGPLACCCLHFEGGFSIHCHSADEEEVPVPSKPHMAQGQNNRRLTALRAERHTLTFAERSSCSACHELLCSRAFLFIVLRSAQHPQIPPFFFLQIFQGIWPMPHSLLNHSALALFTQRTRIPTSARSIGFCAIWVCICSSSSPSSSSITYISACERQLAVRASCG